MVTGGYRKVKHLWGPYPVRECAAGVETWCRAERGGGGVLGVADLFQWVIRGLQGLSGNLQGG